MIKDLSCIEFVKQSECKGCLLHSYNKCEDIYKDIAGCICYDENDDSVRIMRKKEVWETCTKENTKAGDPVRPRGRECEAKCKVMYIYEDGQHFLMSSGYVNEEKRYLYDFEIKK